MVVAHKGDIKMNKYLYILISLLVIFLLYHCSYSEIQQEETKEYNNKVEYAEQFKGFFYIMPRDEQKQFAEKLKKVELGDNLDDVIKILGKPSQLLKDHDSFLRLFVTSYTLSYNIIRKNEITPNTIHDRNVTIFFDRKKKLEDIFSCFEGTSKGPKLPIWEKLRKQFDIEYLNP